MAVGNLYIARTQYTYLGEAMENRFYITHLAGVGNAGDLAGAIDLIYLPSQKAVQSIAVGYVQIVIFNMNDPTDFLTQPVAGAGVRPGDFSPPFQSWGFTNFSTDNRLRSGGKRLGGISESDVSDGFAVAGVVAALTNMALVWFNTFQDVGAANTYQQVAHTDGNTKTGGNPVTVPLRSVSYRRVTTQSSRKFSF